MHKKGFVLFSSLLYMSVLTFIYLVNLNMYTSQMKLNEEINLSYQAQIMSRLAIERVIAGQHEMNVSNLEIMKDDVPEIQENDREIIEEEEAKDLASNDSLIPSGKLSEVEDQRNLDREVTTRDFQELKDGKWTIGFNQGQVMVELKDQQFSTEVFLAENGHKYAYTNVPYDRRMNQGM